MKRYKAVTFPCKCCREQAWPFVYVYAYSRKQVKDILHDYNVIQIIEVSPREENEHGQIRSNNE